jgi:hypothetical protein
MSLYCNALLAQDVDANVVTLTITSPAESVVNDSVTVVAFRKNEWTITPVVRTTVAGVLKLKFRAETTGLYQLAWSKHPIKCDIILTPADSDLRLSIQQNTIDHSFVVNNPENNAYAELSQLLSDRHKELLHLDDTRKRISQVNPRYYELKERFKVQSDSVKEIYNSALAIIQERYKATYVARVLIPCYAISTRFADKERYLKYDNHHAYYHLNFFNDFKLNDADILNHPAFYSQLNFYLQNFAGEYEEDFIASADYLMRRELATEVKREIISAFVKHLYQHQQNDAIHYLLNTWSDGCTDDAEIDLIVKAIIEDPVKEGNMIPDAWVYDMEHSPVNLHEMIATGDSVLVIFWRSDCSLCHETLASLSMKVPKLKVVTVLIDDPIGEKWRAYLHPSWVNLQAATGSKEVVKAFGLYKTPLLLLVSSSKQVVKNSALLLDFNLN